MKHFSHFSNTFISYHDYLERYVKNALRIGMIEVKAKLKNDFRNDLYIIYRVDKLLNPDLHLRSDFSAILYFRNQRSRHLIEHTV